jgi:hypothetical protein
MKKRPCVFIIIPITPRGEGNHAIEFLENIDVGIDIASQLICEGFSVYCPALDFHYWLGRRRKPTADDIYEQDISILLKMDAVYTAPRWETSPNCKREMDTAWKNNIPCFCQIDVIKNWKETIWNKRQQNIVLSV